MVELQGARVLLRDKRVSDAEQDYIWRSDHELARLDAAYPLTMNYDRYVKIFQDQLRYPTPGSHHFGIDVSDGKSDGKSDDKSSGNSDRESDGNCMVKFIGNCMYYDLDSINREAELGIVIGDRDYWSGAYGYDAVVTLLDYMFTERNLKRVYLHTLQWNDRAQKCFSKCGFNLVREVRRMGQDFLLMEVLRDDWFQNAEQRLATRWDYLHQKGGEAIHREDAPPVASPSSSVTDG